MLREPEKAGMEVELSIVMPCLDEAETLAASIDAGNCLWEPGRLAKRRTLTARVTHSGKPQAS